jgi:hypothetical protein
MSYLVTVISGLVLCFGLQLAALQWSGGRFTKNESNFYSSLGRIQAGATGKPELIFLGSSLTGRLPDRSHGFGGVANMGCDGGSAIDALRAMDNGLLPLAPDLIFELNTIERALDSEPSAIARGIAGPWFQVGRKIPVLGAYARPSGFFYSLLLAKKIGSFDIEEGPPDLQIDSRPVSVPMPERDWDDDEEALIDEICGIVGRLRRRGCEVTFIWLPPARVDDSPMISWKMAIPAASGAKWWDIGQHADPALIEVTDGAHMAAPSAARTVRTVLKVFAPEQ